MALDREELAWAAGFFDGEGTTNAYLNRKIWQPQLSVSQNQWEPLERFQAAVHGVGKIYGPYKRNRKNPIHTYRVSGFERTQAVVAMLWPWLCTPKKEQAVVALSRFLSTFEAPSTSEERREARRLYMHNWYLNRKVL